MLERIAPADANVGLVDSTPARVACVQPKKNTASAVVATLFVVLRVLKRCDMTVLPVRLARFEVSFELRVPGERFEHSPSDELRTSRLGIRQGSCHGEKRLSDVDAARRLVRRML
jgi:hypothetical protein